MTPENPTPNTAYGDSTGATNIERKARRRRGHQDIGPDTRAKSLKSTADNAHDAETADQNTERPSTLPRTEPDPSGGEGPAQTHESEHTEQELEPKVDGNLGVSRNINDKQPNADNLPATIDAGNAKLPASYERAKQALAECESIDECKAWGNKAAALAAYGRMQGDTDLEKQALRIRAYAARRAGELLHEIPGETGGRPPRMKNSGGHAPEFSGAQPEPAGKPMSARSAAVRDAGMSTHQAKEAMRVAALSKAEFDRQVNGSKPPRVATLAKQGTRKRPQPTASATDAPHATADDHKNHSIGAETVARAIEKWQADIPLAQQNKIKVNTRERRVFVSAIERLPLSDAEWARKLAFFVEQGARETPQ